MQVFDEIGPLKAYLRAVQREGLRVGFVPTMGALHDGHLSLVEVAKASAEVVVASIFVNPTQFGPGEDLAVYPRDRAGDTAQLEAAGCGVLFHPRVDDIYPDGHQTRVHVSEVTRGLCGAHRPGHFEGVTTVVAALFGIVRPDVAVLGQKDYQQLITLRTMARDLHLDVEVVGAPLVRDPDGLAMSSRNAYLSPSERERALGLSRGLARARTLFDGGERSAERLLEAARAELEAVQIRAEYLELRHAVTLAPLARADEPSVLLVAAQVGKTRLIDNVVLRGA